MNDQEYMKLALELAERGRGWAFLNPIATSRPAGAGTPIRIGSF